MTVASAACASGNWKQIKAHATRSSRARYAPIFIAGFSRIDVLQDLDLRKGYDFITVSNCGERAALRASEMSEDPPGWPGAHGKKLLAALSLVCWLRPLFGRETNSWLSSFSPSG